MCEYKVWLVEEDDDFSFGKLEYNVIVKYLGIEKYRD